MIYGPIAHETSFKHTNVHLYSIQFNHTWGDVNIIHIVLAFLGMKTRAKAFTLVCSTHFYSLLFYWFFGVFLWPEASLISSAVRIRAIRVEVKWTVLSSAMGMFILTRRWEEEMSGDRKMLDHRLKANSPMRTYSSPREINLCAAVIQYPPWI